MLTPQAGLSPLCAAVIGGDNECATLLINAGADVNNMDNINLTPIMQAAIKNHVECIRTLLQEGAGVNMFMVERPWHTQ